MSENSGFLINDVNPAAPIKQEFLVSSQAVRLRAFGIRGTDYVQLEQQVALDADGLWAPVCRGGQPVRLTETNTQHVEIISGSYRVVPNEGHASQIAVYFETDEYLIDKKLVYNYDTLQAGFSA